jgi:hypothetical protein
VSATSFCLSKSLAVLNWLVVTVYLAFTGSEKSNFAISSAKRECPRIVSATKKQQSQFFHKNLF